MAGKGHDIAKMHRKSMQTFYSSELLSRRWRGKFSIPWLAATYLSKLTARHFKICDVSEICNEIIKFVMETEVIAETQCKPPKISLYLSSQLLYGLCIIHLKQSQILFCDCNALYMSMCKPSSLIDETKKKQGKQLKRAAIEIPEGSYIPIKTRKELDDFLQVEDLEFLNVEQPTAAITLCEETSFRAIDNFTETIPPIGSPDYRDHFIPVYEAADVQKESSVPLQPQVEPVVNVSMPENIQPQAKVAEEPMELDAAIASSDVPVPDLKQIGSVSTKAPRNGTSAASNEVETNIAVVTEDHVDECVINFPVTRTKTKVSVSVAIGHDIIVIENREVRCKSSVSLPLAAESNIKKKASVPIHTEDSLAVIEPAIASLGRASVPICTDNVIINEQVPETADVNTHVQSEQQPDNSEMKMPEITEQRADMTTPRCVQRDVIEKQHKVTKTLPSSSEINLQPVLSPRRARRFKNRKLLDLKIEIPGNVFNEHIKNYGDTMRKETFIEKLRTKTKTKSNLFLLPGHAKFKSSELINMFERHLNSAKEPTYDLQKLPSHIRGEEEEELARERASGLSLQTSLVSSAVVTPAEKSRTESPLFPRPVRENTTQLEQLLELPEDQINDVLPNNTSVPLPQNIFEKEQSEIADKSGKAQEPTIEPEIQANKGNKELPIAVQVHEKESSEILLDKGEGVAEQIQSIIDTNGPLEVQDKGPGIVTPTCEKQLSEIPHKEQPVQSEPDRILDNVIQVPKTHAAEEPVIQAYHDTSSEHQGGLIQKERQRKSQCWTKTTVMKQLVDLWLKQAGIAKFSELCFPQENTKMDASQVFLILLHLHARKTLILYQKERFSDIFIKKFK